MINTSRGIAVIGIAVFCASSAGATTYTATASNLAAVWRAATAGDTIKLVGSFGETKIGWKTSAKAITLDATKAVFTDTLDIMDVDGLNVIGGKFGSTTAKTAYGRAVVVYNGSNISFLKPVVVGNHDGQGIAFNATTNASVWSGTFSNLWVGVALSQVTGGTVSKNKIVGSVADGIDIADSHMVNATYNSCTGGAPGPGVHPDCIQLWSVAGHPVQSDIMISRNTAIGPTQGFTSFNPADGGGLRISILHNVVHGSYAQGIACYGCVDSNISYNSVTTLPGSTYVTNINVIGGTNNIELGNTIGVRPAAVPGAKSFALSRFPLVASGSASEAGLPGAAPEPALWLMMITGFGLAGSAMRRRRAMVVAA